MTTPAPRHDQRVILIAAVAHDQVAGAGGRLPWHAPDDLRHFRELTLEHSVIMGQRTWDGLPSPLTERTNIVLSQDPTLHAPGALTARSLPEALHRAGPGTVFVIGGRQPWEQALPLATEIRLTHLDLRIPGDVHFPPIDTAIWVETERRTSVGPVNGVPTRIDYLTYTRREPPQDTPSRSTEGPQ